MMREGWEIKKLGEVCEVERGGSPRPISAFITNESNGVNWIKIGDATDASRYINSTKEKIKPEGVKKSRFVHKGDFILSNSMSFGRPYILGIDGCIHDGWLVLHDKNNYFNKDYLYYYLSSQSIYAEFKRLAVGGVVNNLNSELVRGVKILIPPLSVQERIVSELDLLSGVIEKKKEQLKELDNLAQAIFFDMFGDPITNEKGWEMKKLINFAQLINGRAYKQDELLDKGKYLVLRVGNFFSTKSYYYSDLELPEDKYCNDGDLLYAWSASFGARIWNGGRAIFHYHIWKIIYDESQVNKIFLCALLNNATKGLSNDMHGVTMMHLTKNGMEHTAYTLPPLPLQQSFAEKISAIEEQKALIKQSLAEAETLFDSRMSYYFD